MLTNRRTFLLNLSVLSFASIATVHERNLIGRTSTNGSKNLLTEFKEVKEIAKDVFFIEGKISYFKNANHQEAECNNGWIIFENFVLLIDANFPAKTSVLLEEIKKTTNKPAKYVFNTHHHADDLYGNRFWAEHGAAIISHAKVIEELQKYETVYFGTTPGRWEASLQRRSDLKNYPLLPPEVIFNDKIIIVDKNKRVELLYLGAGHTKGDGLAWLPEEKILFTGDACLNGPYNLLIDSNVKCWMKSLKRMKVLQPEILVPGHGNLGDATTIENQLSFFQVIYNWVQEKHTAGADLKELLKQLHQLRKLIAADARIKTYLIPEPAVVDAFSLAAQVSKVFEELNH